MRIVHVINGLGPGGAERSLVELLPYYHEAGIESIVVHTRDREVGFAAEARGLDCELHRLPGESFRSWIPNARRYLKTVRPDLVHTSLLDSHLIGRLGAARTGIPVLSSLLNTAYDPSRAGDPNINQLGFRVWREIDGFTARHLVTHFHALTNAVKESYYEALRIPREKITVVGRGRSRTRLGEATPERRARIRTLLGIPADRTVLVNVGRQDYQKGQRFLVAAMRRVVEARPDVLLLVAGRPGPETTRLHDTVVAHKLQDHVRFLGHRDDVTDIVAGSDLFVFPSLFEGLGGAVLEAMGLGLPVVASDLPVLREVLGETAAFAAPGQPDAIADRVLRLLADPDRRAALAQATQARFAERYELDRTAEQMVAMYRDVLAQCGSSSS